MKYKTYEEVLLAEDYLTAFKEYLKDKGMTTGDFLCSEEARKWGQKSAAIRFTTPYPERYFPAPRKKNEDDSTQDRSK